MPDAQPFVEDALAGIRPAAPASLHARLRAELTAPTAPIDPLREAFEDHGGVLYGYLLALSGRDGWLAEEVLGQAFRSAAEELPDLSALLRAARHATLTALAKSGAPSAVAGLPPADAALLLERRLLSLTDLAQAWSTSEAALRPRLHHAALAALDAADAAPCAERRALHADAAADLLDDADAEQLAMHLESCADCARAHQALEDRLTLPTTELPAPEKTWKRLNERANAAPTRSAEELGIRVAVSCTYCHDTLDRGKAAFCALCLAPHHPECFAEHAACCAPGCSGQELVYPSGPPQRPARRSLWSSGLILGGILTAAALSGGGTAALVSDPSSSSAGEVEAPGADRSLAGRAIEDSRPVPHLEPGAKRATVEAALGKPQAVTERGDRLIASYYRDGARVIYDDHGRMIQASFFGTLWSDSGPDANGNRFKFSPKGNYAAVPWSHSGQVAGQPLSPTVLARVQSSVPDANGNQMLMISDGVLLQVAAGPPYRVEAIHLAPDVSPDANGNVAPGVFSFTQHVLARDACARLLKATDPAELDALLEPRRFLGYSSGTPVALVEVSGRRVPDDDGLELILRHWHIDEGYSSWTQIQERMSWDGRLLSTSEYRGGLEPAHDWQVIEGGVIRPDRYLVTHDHGGQDRPQERILSNFPNDQGYAYDPRNHTSQIFTSYFLPVLASRRNVGEWSVYSQQPILERSRQLNFDTGVAPQPWEGQSVLTFSGMTLAATEDRALLRLDEQHSLVDAVLEPIGRKEWISAMLTLSHRLPADLSRESRLRIAWPPSDHQPAWIQERPRKPKKPKKQ